MCGIFLYRGTTIDSKTLQTLSDKLTKRGPEQTSEYKINNILMKFYRLAINGITNGFQPFVKDKVVVMCNGEIYNYKELIRVENLEVSTESDCEVILHLYLKYKNLETVLNKLDGVFALTIYDENQDTVYVARDPYGVRSLYIGSNDTDYIITSEMKSIPSDYYIMQFPGGNYWSDKTSFFTKWYTRSELEVSIHSIYKKLDNAVQKRLLSNRPIGCLLSGGLDSSIIAYLLSKYIPNLHTFSIGLEGSTDLYYAKKVAEHLKTNHHEIKLTKEEFLNTIPEVIQQIESYDTTTVRASTPMYLLCKYIKENTDIKVIFSGEGSDEICGSYLYFHNAPSDSEFQEETERLLDDIYYFDGLRSDKCISAHGLEARIPFLDKDFVNYFVNISAKLKRNSVEKYILRNAFKSCLPDSVLWRTKEAFSDGVSHTNNSWHHIIQEYIKDIPVNEIKYNHNIPILDESKWYRSIFSEHYPNQDKVIPYYWLPKWSGEIHDPSARNLHNYIQK